MKSIVLRRMPATLLLLILVSLCTPLRAAESKIEFTQETLDNGLTVIYAPLHQAPVIHVRVAYHVGSKDERADRQGFAHMFEHMMFRGSAHVKPEEHMKLIGIVGGYSNAFTSHDQTTYVNTIPSNQLEMALYLEADRMASFKVSQQIYATERKVVGEEWGRHMNAPYGTMFDNFLRLAFTTHSYRWTPIGNMDHLRSAPVEELQDFFNTYYVPNNATLIISGDFQIDAAKAQVKKYFGWIPKGADIVRNSPVKPAQTEEHRATIPMAVPLPAILIGYHLPNYKSDDHYALSLFADIIGGGSSSRVYRQLVSGDHPMCVSAQAFDEQMEDSGFFGFHATIMRGKNAEDVEKTLLAIAEEGVKNGVTEEELTKAKALTRATWIHQRSTADSIANALTSEALFAGDANRANSDMDKINAVTTADIQRVAAKYVIPSNSTIMHIKPDVVAAIKAATSQPTTQAVAPSTRPVVTRQVTFPADYPQTAPLNTAVIKTKFEKGVESTIDGVKVIVMSDSRIPSISCTLTMRRGSHSEVDKKAGLGGITAAMLRRGAGELTYAKLSEDLESRAISIDASDSGDLTRLSFSCPTEQIEHAFMRAREILRSPRFDQDEFDKLKAQSLSELQARSEDPDAVAGWELATAVFADTPLGRHSTVETVGTLTLDDVKSYYGRMYIPNDAILCIAGDITVERAKELASKLLADWKQEELAAVKYDLPPAPQKPRIILVDRPEGRQSLIRIDARAYDVHDDVKYAGRICDTILSHGIESRLGRYVRAEKGYVYSVWGIFSPGRHSGIFRSGGETSFKTTADTVEAIFKVFGDMQGANVTDQELTEAKLRVTGGMVMGMQTIEQQGNYRVEAVLDDYPIDYFDNYAQNVNAVTADQVRALAQKYIRPDHMVVVVVAPAKEVEEQLKRLGDVEVLPMPSRRNGGVGPATKELVKPTPPPVK